MEKMAAEYDKLSLIAMPSIWFEMAPLVLQEAWSRGIPVYGTARIGQADELRARGGLVDPNTPETWQRAIKEAFVKHLSASPDVAPFGERATKPTRTMANVAEEMVFCYTMVEDDGPN
jgi:glycosyltransferase involved in cell wall biosynthesis